MRETERERKTNRHTERKRWTEGYHGDSEEREIDRLNVIFIFLKVHLGDSE